VKGIRGEPRINRRTLQEGGFPVAEGYIVLGKNDPFDSVKGAQPATRSRTAGEVKVYDPSRELKRPGRIKNFLCSGLKEEGWLMGGGGRGWEEKGRGGGLSLGSKERTGNEGGG